MKNLALNCWFSQCNNTRIITAKLSPYYFTYLIFNLPFISEWDGRYDWLQTTAEHDVVWSMWAGYFPVYTWTENGSFIRNLTSWPMPFWLVILTEHKVTHCYVLNAVCHCLVAGQLYPSWGFPSADSRSFQVSNPCQAIHSILSVHHTALTDRDF